MIYSREGGNVTIFDERQNVITIADGDCADEPMIYPRRFGLCALATSYTIGGWIIDDEASGMSSRGQYALPKTLRFVRIILPVNRLLAILLRRP